MPDEIPQPEDAVSEDELDADAGDDLTPDDTDDTEESAQSEETPPWQEAVQRLEAENRRLADDLRRSVGRIQSLTSQLESGKGDSARIEAERQEQFASVVDLLTDMTTQMDETVLPPEVRRKAMSVREAIARQTERASLRDELMKELAPKEAPRPDNTAAQMTEQVIVASMQAQGLDPDDPQFADAWREGATLLSSQGPEAVVKHFAQKIAAVTNERTAGERRQARKKAAGKGSPDPAGAAQSPEDRLHTANVEEGVKLLRSMGINI